MILSIDNAEYKGDYIISIKFSDGTKRNIDFSTFLKSANNPMTKKYLDKNLFQSFAIDYGDLHWNNYEMCFPLWNLHEGKI